MSATLMSQDDLHLCLASIAPVELQGMRLLKERPHVLSASKAIPRPQLVDAVTELIAYTDQCAAAAHKLAGIGPVPLKAVSVLEFGI
ncbi:MAG: hypothetical protein UZ13_03239 [Chloroflexi bacterium OLB13]|nr:MAG: hypothetical protein UZ13_03239 [Chloroflexi bacterium OLB13]